MLCNDFRGIDVGEKQFVRVRLPTGRRVGQAAEEEEEEWPIKEIVECCGGGGGGGGSDDDEVVRGVSRSQ